MNIANVWNRRNQLSLGGTPPAGCVFNIQLVQNATRAHQWFPVQPTWIDWILSDVLIWTWKTRSSHRPVLGVWACPGSLRDFALIWSFNAQQSMNCLQGNILWGLNVHGGPIRPVNNHDSIHPRLRHLNVKPVSLNIDFLALLHFFWLHGAGLERGGALLRHRRLWRRSWRGGAPLRLLWVCTALRTWSSFLLLHLEREVSGTQGLILRSLLLALTFCHLRVWSQSRGHLTWRGTSSTAGTDNKTLPH